MFSLVRCVLVHLWIQLAAGLLHMVIDSLMEQALSRALWGPKQREVSPIGTFREGFLGQYLSRILQGSLCGR